MRKLNDAELEEGKSKELPEKFYIRNIQPYDLEEIIKIKQSRDDRFEHIIRSETENEIQKQHDEYKLFVGVLDGKVVGITRLAFFGKNDSRVKYPSPEGWYQIGSIVLPDYRRQNIARAFHDHRVKYVLSKYSYKLYSMAFDTNHVSIKMHESFGFEKIKEGPGFVHVRFESGNGFLFCKSLNK
jgi:GNAT superfamily N-acetyltransferase